MLPHGQLSDAMAASMRVQAMSTLAGTNPKQELYVGRWSAVLFEPAAVQSGPCLRPEAGPMEH